MSENAAAAMELDDDNNVSAASQSGLLQSLPLALFGRIGKNLDIGNSDLTNYCVVGGKEIADEVRHEYLHENDDYLRYTIVSGPPKLRKQKILQWMEINKDWTKHCTKSKITRKANRTHLKVLRSRLTRLNLQESRYGAVSFQGYVGATVGENLPNEGDLLLCVNGAHVVPQSLSFIEKLFVTLRSSRHVRLLFMRDSDFIFNDPVAAIRMGLTPVLKHMIDNKYIDVNDRFATECGSLPEMPLLHHSVRNTADASCFNYLMSLPDIDCAAEYRGTSRCNIIHACSADDCDYDVAVYALKALVKDSRAPNINALDGNGRTALHYVCKAWNAPYHERITKLNILLENGADPLLGNVLPINVLYSRARDGQHDDPQFKEMAALLLQGKRDI